MSETTTNTGNLREISPDKIERNPENPRLFFRGEEMDTLMSSIKQFGVQVPINVYPDGRKFVLIDGERRWRCAIKLNLKTIPALVQKKPSKLENLLLMYNIHALREQWDYFTIASKLPEVIKLYRLENGTEPNEIQLSERTGLTRSQIRRCTVLLDLPAKYRRMLGAELTLPKQQQKLSEDLFIEMERALKTVGSRVPSVIGNKNKVRDALIEKFHRGIVRNVTDFRMLSKIATSVENLGIEESRATSALKSIFNPNNNVGIEDVFTQRFESTFDEHKIILQVETIADYLESFSRSNDSPQLSNEAIAVLRKLRKLIDRALGS
jgi:ParB/RepB/Spo0J family partition protein